MFGRSAVVTTWILAMTMMANSHATSSQNERRISTQKVHLAESVPVHCVAVLADHGVATIVLSREELDSLATVTTWDDSNEASRLAFIAGSRARELQKQIGLTHDIRGCALVDGVVSLDARFLVGHMLEQGHAAVIARRLNLPEPVLQIRHIDTLMDGWDEFHLLDGTQIWGYGTRHSG